MKALIWKVRTSARVGCARHPADLADKARRIPREAHRDRRRVDDEAMEAYLEGKSRTMKTSSSLIRKGTIDGLLPVFCGSAFKNKGVQPLLDAVSTILPSPVDVPAIKGIDAKTEEKWTASLR
jgi:elongation factor G